MWLPVPIPLMFTTPSLLVTCCQYPSPLFCDALSPFSQLGFRPSRALSSGRSTGGDQCTLVAGYTMTKIMVSALYDNLGIGLIIATMSSFPISFYAFSTCRTWCSTQNNGTPKIVSISNLLQSIQALDPIQEIRPASTRLPSRCYQVCSSKMHSFFFLFRSFV